MSRVRLVFDDRVLDYLAERQVERSEATEQRRLALKGCLEKMAKHHRLLIEQRYALDGSVQKIADGQGKSVGAISQALFRIREALLKCEKAHRTARAVPLRRNRVGNLRSTRCSVAGCR